MLQLGKFIRRLFHPMLLIGLVVISGVPVRSWAFAQGGSAPLWVVRSRNTSEFGVSDPKGLAYSSEADTFLLLDGSANATLITMGEEQAGTRTLPEVQADPLNAAFDARTGSLFVFDRARSELAEIKADAKGLPDLSARGARIAVNALSIADPQGIAFSAEDGRLFVLDAGKAQIVSAASHPTLGFDASQIQRISLNKLGKGTFRGLAYNPGNGHLYVSDPGQKKLYELTQNGELFSTVDLASLGIRNPSAMTFAPSVDNTDEPGIYDLFLLDAAQTARSGSTQGGQIVELSLQAPRTLPPGTTLVPASLIQIIDTSNAAWIPSSPDPAGVDYWPLTNRLLIVDSEVDEMPPYWQGKNVFQSTTSGSLTNTCSTTSYTNEPTGVAINPNNNHVFITTDFNDKVFEVSLGSDGQYCTADDTVTSTNISGLYGINDAEDVAYGNNTLFIAGGTSAEVYRIPLGADGVLGGDDGAMTHFDTAALGFADMEAIGYNADAGTLFIASAKASDDYLGETTPTGTLLRAYDLSLMGSAGNIRSDVTYAPGSQNPTVKSLYIASRGVDNDNDPNENDGRVWEISLGTPPPPPTPTHTPTPIATFTPSPTATPFSTPPGKATLLSPTGEIGSATPTYTWNKVLGATYYYLWVNGPSGNVIKQWVASSTVCGASICSVTPATALAGGSHTWWIRTWNSNGHGPWSDPLNFTVPQPMPPIAATLISPNGSAGSQPTYTWNEVLGGPQGDAATWYYLWVNGPSGNLIKTWYQASAVCSGGICSVTPGVLLSSGAHTWWIRTWNPAGHGPWSSGMNFTVTP